MDMQPANGSPQYRAYIHQLSATAPCMWGHRGSQMIYIGGHQGSEVTYRRNMTLKNPATFLQLRHRPKTIFVKFMVLYDETNTGNT